MADHKKIPLQRHETLNSFLQGYNYGDIEQFHFNKLKYNYKMFKKLVKKVRKQSRIPIAELIEIFPNTPCVYFFGEIRRQYTTKDNKCNLLYIGQTVSPLSRFGNHISGHSYDSIMSRLAYHHQHKFIHYDFSKVDEKIIPPADYDEEGFEKTYDRLIETLTDNLWLKMINFPILKDQKMRLAYEDYFIKKFNPLLNRSGWGATKNKEAKRPSRKLWLT